MCLAIPGKVIEAKKGKAVIDYGKEQRKVDNIINAKVGDYVIVALGKVAMKISEEEAMKSHQKSSQNL